MYVDMFFYKLSHAQNSLVYNTHEFWLIWNGASNIWLKESKVRRVLVYHVWHIFYLENGYNVFFRVHLQRTIFLFVEGKVCCNIDWLLRIKSLETRHLNGSNYSLKVYSLLIRQPTSLLGPVQEEQQKCFHLLQWDAAKEPTQVRGHSSYR
jgi:hypothetical protein